MELLTVIALMSVVLLLTGTTLHALLKAEQLAARDAVLDRTLGELALQFRQDVHAATTAAVAADGAQLELHDGSPLTIVYEVAPHSVTRTVRAGADQRQRREEYHLVAGDAVFRSEERAGRQWAVLEATRVGAGVSERSPWSSRVFPLRIEAVVRRQPATIRSTAPRESQP